MKNFRTQICAGLTLAAASSVALAQSPSGTDVPVTVDTYNRAESDAYFGLTVKAGALGKFVHGRELAPIDRRGIIRPNRDTLYSLAVFDFDAGPATVTLPDPGKRYMVMRSGAAVWIEMINSSLSARNLRESRRDRAATCSKACS